MRKKDAIKSALKLVLISVSCVSFPQATGIKGKTTFNFEQCRISEVIAKLSDFYDIGISLEIGRMDEVATNVVVDIIAREHPVTVISNAVARFGDYAVKEDAQTGSVNVYPNRGSVLEWNICGCKINNETLWSCMVEADKLGFCRHGVLFAPERGNLTWTDLPITVEFPKKPTSAIHALNLIAARLPFRARWIIHHPIANKYALLSFVRYGTPSLPNDEGIK